MARALRKRRLREIYGVSPGNARFCRRMNEYVKVV